MSAQPPPNPPDGQQSVRRILDAISPGLAAELGRIINEQRDKLVAEAKVQLSSALIERESQLQAAAEAARQSLRAETAEQVRRDVTRELEAQFEQKLSRELRSLKDRLDTARGEAESAWHRERAELSSQGERWRVLSDFYRRTGTVISQVEILQRFLKASTHYASGIALYLHKPDGLRRWSTEGEVSAFPELVSEDTKDPDWYWAPVTVRSRTILAVAATAVEDREGLDALVSALKRAIETLGLRLGARGTELSDTRGGQAGSVSRQPDPL